MNERWAEYVRAQMRGSQQDLADRSKVGTASISRWLKGSAPSPIDVIKFARNLGESPVQALVMAGHLTPAEANTTVKDLSLSRLNDIVLIDELRRRAIQRT